MIARGVEAACWMAGRDHDYPEQFAAGLKPHAVQEKYYYARRPEITRVVDISGVVDQKVEANRANQAKGPAGRHGSRLRAELAKKNQRLPLLGDDDATADRNYIKEFVLARNRELGPKIRRGIRRSIPLHRAGNALAGRRLHSPACRTVSVRPSTATRVGPADTHDVRPMKASVQFKGRAPVLRQPAGHSRQTVSRPRATESRWRFRRPCRHDCHRSACQRCLAGRPSPDR